MPLNFSPDKDIPSLNGKVFLITGGTAGLGSGSIAELAKHNPSHIFFTGRNQASADALIARINKSNPGVLLTFIKCDISSFASVKAGAATFRSQSQRLDVIMLNAGIMAVGPAVSADGYETQFATNHLGHALLVEELLPILRSTARLPDVGGDVRIVNMTSTAHELAPRAGIEFDTLRSAQEKLGAFIPGHTWTRYGQSKLAQLLYSRELAKMYPEITSVAVHPGVIMTNLFGKLDFLTKLPILMASMNQRVAVEEGHFNQCWAATCDKGKLTNGGYYVPLGSKGTMKWKGDEATLGERLWEWTQNEIQSQGQ